MTSDTADTPLAGAAMGVRESIEASIARIEAENPKLHAVSALFADAARARADALDQHAAAGGALGPLHGVPVLLKELVDIAGQPTRFGSRCYASAPAARNAPLIDRLEAAGAVILGTAHMVEFAVGSWGTNAQRGAPWNPADRAHHRVAGGSSSGSGVAVAAGFAPIAFGSDTGGSIRIPATLCGVVGFKPSYGLIPMQGAAPTGPSFDTLGPLARSVADARRAAAAASGLTLAHAPIDLSGLTIAVVPDDALDPIEAAALEAYDSVHQRLSHAGARLSTLRPPMSFVAFQKINGDIAAFEAYRHLKTLIDDEDAPLDPFVRARIRQGAAISDSDYRARIAAMHESRAAFAADFKGVDALLLPGTPMTAPRLEDVDESQIPMSRYTRMANCLNLCAIALPAAPASAGALPAGVQLAARSGEDAKLLAIAEAAERLIATPQ